jgi:amino acid transporter
LPLSLLRKGQSGHTNSAAQALLFTAIIIALQGVLYTYDGWYGVIYFGEEVRNPKRDVVRSMFGVCFGSSDILVVNLATCTSCQCPARK